MSKLLIVSLLLSLAAFSAAAQTGKRKTTRKTAHAKTKMVVPPAAATTTAPTGGLGSGIGSGTGSGIGTGTGNGVGSGSGSGVGVGNGRGSGEDSGSGVGGQTPNAVVSADKSVVPLKITSRPRAEITPAARQNQDSGIVTLRVTFLAGGQIGDVTVVSGLADGLNESAVNAARLIKFEPARKDNKPVTVVKTIQYSFQTY